MNNLLNGYKNSLISAWGYNDYNDWPVKFNSIMHLFLEEFYDSFISDYMICKEMGYSLYDIAMSFSYPARVYRMINGIIFGMKRKRIPIKRQREVVQEMLLITQELKYGSIFNDDGKNIIYSPEKLNECASKICFKKANYETAKLVQKICGVLWSYTEATFFRAHDITKEFHGLYEDPISGNNILVREYLNLCSAEIWNEIQLLPCKTIKIYCMYRKDLKLTIDSYNHLFIEQGNYIDDLVGYYIESDGKELDIHSLDVLVQQMFKSIHQIHTWVKNTDWKEHTKKYAEIFWYRKKPMSDLINVPCKVPVSAYEKIEKGTIDERRVKNMTERQIELLISSII